MDKKYEHVKFIIERFDHYYDTVNNKGSFYIGLNTFILGGICAGYISIENKIEHSLCLWILLSTIFVLSITAIFYTINAISPYVKDNENNEDTPSLIFFGGITRYNLNAFLEKIKSETIEETNEDMFRQAHCLANGLNAKFRKLRIVSYLLLVQFIVIPLLCIYILKNYTP
jgi:predicted membrane channel-forming protein YqfA (hemolysin III family)